MEKKLLLLVVVVVVCLLGSVALALDPMGPPAAGLKQGKWSAGFDYSYSDMDLKAKNGKLSYYWQENDDGIYDSESGSEKLGSTKVKSVKANKIYANIGYGITDNWDVFIRLGGADADFDSGEEDLDIKFDSDYVFAYGFGTKVTFWEQSPELKWGGLFQMSWANLNSTTQGTATELADGEDYTSFETWSSSTEVDISEIQIAVGPTWTPTQGFSIYGGPFLHFVNGDLEAKYNYSYSDDYPYAETETGKISGDIHEDNCFGGYIGAQIELGGNACVSAEWMTTGDADAFGASVICRF
jgi:hypothetical protein